MATSSPSPGNITAGDTPPTTAISKEWWYLKDHTVLSKHTAVIKVSNFSPEYYSIPKTAEGAERSSIHLACITPLALTHPLLTTTYMSTAASYTLLSARTAAWNLDAPLAPLIIWLRASLYQT